MKKILILLFLGFGFSLFGQMAEEKITNLTLNDSTLLNQVLIPLPIDSIIAYGKIFVGKPYRYKTPSGAVFDCSGFLAYIFQAKNYQIPHNSGEMFNLSKPIELSEVKKGDLLFFKGWNLENPRIGHVSLVVDVTEHGPVMMHSSRRGVIVEEYTLAYYKKRFLKAGRLPFFYLEENFSNEIPHKPLDQ